MYIRLSEDNKVVIMYKILPNHDLNYCISRNDIG